MKSKIFSKRGWFVLLALLVVLLSIIFIKHPESSSKNYMFINGQWYDGSTFERKVMYSSGAHFRSVKPLIVDSIVDLQGRYVVPPFADAHVHMIDPAMEAQVNLFLDHGIFYVKDQGSVPMLTKSLSFGKYWNHPHGIDVPNPPNQVFSAPGGHPVQILHALIAMNVLPTEWSELDNMNGNALIAVEGLEDLDAQWKAFLDSNPGHVKVMLLYSEEYDLRRNGRMFGFRKGLDPALIPEIVERARAAHLDVAAHVYTAHDFHTAIVSGVKEITHLPGLGYDKRLGIEHFLLSKADAELAAEKGVLVHTTVTEVFKDTLNASWKKEHLLIPNLRTLLGAGVQVIIGSDQWRGTSLSEVLILAQFGIFSNKDLLNMWSQATPRSIFPERKIGELKDGFEASFLALDANPLDDLENVQKIGLRFKQGHFLTISNGTDADPKVLGVDPWILGWYGENLRRVFVEEGQLYLQRKKPKTFLGGRNLKLKLEPMEDDLYKLTYHLPVNKELPVVRFERSEDGLVHGLTFIYSDGREEYVKKD